MQEDLQPEKSYRTETPRRGVEKISEVSQLQAPIQ